MIIIWSSNDDNKNNDDDDEDTARVSESGLKSGISGKPISSQGTASCHLVW